jgi:hypothetical protein
MAVALAAAAGRGPYVVADVSAYLEQFWGEPVADGDATEVLIAVDPPQGGARDEPVRAWAARVGVGDQRAGVDGEAVRFGQTVELAQLPAGRRLVVPAAAALGSELVLRGQERPAHCGGGRHEDGHDTSNPRHRAGLNRIPHPAPIPG